MTAIASSSHLRILIALPHNEDALILERELEMLGHRVQVSREFNNAITILREWLPDLLVTEEGLSGKEPDAGLRLAESCRVLEDQINGLSGTRVLMLIPSPDWDRFKRAQQRGAHVIVKTRNLDAAIRYTQTIADNLGTDRMMGPALVGIHRFKGDTRSDSCKNCEWIGATVSYGNSESDVQDLTPLRIAILNTLLFHRRAQSLDSILDACGESPFLKKLLKGHVLRESAIKMEVTRLRKGLGQALEAIGAPYSGAHFLPFRTYGVKFYCLIGNRRLIHIPGTGMSL